MSAPLANPCRILHLETNPADAARVADQLQRDRLDADIHRVESRAALADALAAVATGTSAFDVILADDALSAPDDLSALAIARDRAPDLPFIVVADAIGEEAAVDAIRAGATDYVAKQRLPRLSVAIRRALAQSARQSAAQTAPHEQEAEFQMLADNMPALCWMADADGNIYWYNRRWYDYTGMTPDQLFGWGWQDAHDPAALPGVKAAWQHSIATGEPFEMTFPLRSRDGEFRPFLTRIHPGRDDTGRIVRWFGTNIDITEQRRTEERLRKSEARLVRLLATVPAGVVELHADGRLAFANAAAERALGATAGGLFGALYDDPQWRFQGPHGTPIDTAALPGTRALAGQAVVDHELALRALDGRRIVLLVNAVPVLDDDGNIAGALAAFQDVTARHAQAKALGESEARFRHMADSAPALIGMTGPGGELTFANKHFEHLFGQNPEIYLGDGWRQVIVAADQRRFAARCRAAFRARRSFCEELRVIDQVGQVRWLRCDGVPRLDDEQRFLGYTSCAVDITEARLAAVELEARVVARTADLMEAEARLRQVQKMEAVGQLTGGIAHDFNNMLQAIAGNLELLRRRVTQGRVQEAEHFAEGAQQTLERAGALTHRLLAFARRQQLRPEPIDPNQLVEGMTELIRRTVGPGVAVELRLCPQPSAVLCDASQLENALLNLAINARDAMPAGGTLAISTDDVTLTEAALSEAGLASRGMNGPDVDLDGAEPGQFIQIEVADTGTGMPQEVLARAFEPFFTTKPVGRGTGLGLSQAYGFVRQSGGFVRLESALGQGTAVRLYLPRHRPPEGWRPVPRAATREPELAHTSRAAVLLVEDEAMVRVVAAEHLRELGYSVVETDNGVDGLNLLRSGTRVDVLITDVGLPRGLNGRQLADAARLSRPDIPVLFITGYAGSALEGQLAPGMAVITKPFALNTLATQLRTVLETATPLSAASD